MRVLADVTRELAAKRPDHTALTYVNDGRSWTFAQLDAESNRVAQALLAAGVEPGDRIAYLDRNSPEYFPFLFGGAKVNAASVAVNWRLAVPEMEYILNEGRKDLNVQRYKGLGEMRAEQLWETTMNAETRLLLQVRLEDFTASEEIFSTLMGEDVEVRRKFIEDNALDVKNLDV